MTFLFRNARVLTPFMERRSQVLVKDGRIEGLFDNFDPVQDTQIIDARWMYLVPGYIDLHVHGGGNRSAMEGTADAIVEMANAHALRGTTSILPTTLSMPLADMARAATAVREAMKREDVFSTILGVHQEGPCLSPEQGGAQAKGVLKIPSQTDLTSIIENSPELRIMGIAPELDGAMALGRRLHERGVVVSVAHSNAEYKTAAEAALNGFSDVTHLYSCCSSVIRKNAFRVSGVVEAGLEMDELTVQVIADGCHLPPELLRLIYRCKGADKMYPVTDGLEFSATEQKEGVLYTQKNGQSCVYEDGVMKLPDRAAFAGSVATMDRLVRVMVKAGIPTLDAVRMSTETPARRIGEARKGRIAVGYDADILLLDDELNVNLVMTKGKIIR